MKITKEQLKQIIKEELGEAVSEATADRWQTHHIPVVRDWLTHFTRDGGLRKRVADAVVGIIGFIDQGKADALNDAFYEDSEFLEERT